MTFLRSIPYYKDFPQWLVPTVLLASLFATYVTLWLLWHSPTITTIILLILSMLLLAFFRSTKMLAIFISVAFFGTLHDVYFIANGLWRYGETTIGTIPLYLPLTWGIISIIIVATFKIILILFHGNNHHPPQFIPSLSSTLIALGFALLSMAHFADRPLVLIAIFVLIDITYLLIMRSIPLVLIGILAVCGGAFGEITSVALGAWHYPSGTIAGVPSFIFVGWDVIGVIVAGMYIALDAPDSPWNKESSTKSL